MHSPTVTKMRNKFYSGIATHLTKLRNTNLIAWMISVPQLRTCDYRWLAESLDVQIYSRNKFNPDELMGSWKFISFGYNTGWKPELYHRNLHATDLWRYSESVSVVWLGTRTQVLTLWGHSWDRDSRDKWVKIGKKILVASCTLCLWNPK